MKEQIQAIVTVLSLVNPAICGAMFAQIEANRSPARDIITRFMGLIVLSMGVLAK